MKFLLLLFFTLFSAQATELKILTWNTFMLPRPIKFSDQEIRTEVMIQNLKSQDYDFVFLQEAFTESFRTSLSTGLKNKYFHQYYLDSDAFLFPFFGSGLFVLGRHPFKILDRVFFKDCASADCLASKGSFLIESKLPSGKSVQFALTHLQAGPEYAVIRLSQFQQILGMIKKFKRAGVPQILVGDLNTDLTETDFQEAANLLGMAHVSLTGPILHTNVIDCYKDPDHPKKWIDHLWVDKETRLLSSNLMVREITYEHKGKVCAASDHHAVEGIFRFAK